MLGESNSYGTSDTVTFPYEFLYRDAPGATLGGLETPLIHKAHFAYESAVVTVAVCLWKAGAVFTQLPLPEMPYTVVGCMRVWEHVYTRSPSRVC